MKLADKRNGLTKHNNKTYRKRQISEIRNIAIHHSATTSGSAEAFARYHVNHLDWPGIAYHYVVNKDGSVDFCLDHEVVSYHVGNSNQRALGICLVGDFRIQKLEIKQREAAIELVKKLLVELKLSVDEVWGHSEFPGYSWKPCPSINMEQFRDALSSYQETPSEKITIEPIHRQILTRGDIGTDVQEIQQRLKVLGFNPGPIDGIYGPLTVDAVERFQRSVRIVVDGVVGPQTKKALESASLSNNLVEHSAPSDEPDTNEVQFKGEKRRMLRFNLPMMRGDDVKVVQSALKIEADGIFGPNTEKAVRDFQRKEGLTIDGIVGRQTWDRLF